LPVGIGFTFHDASIRERTLSEDEAGKIFARRPKVFICRDFFWFSSGAFSACWKGRKNFNSTAAGAARKP
jgi:hypothetical protein